MRFTNASSLLGAATAALLAGTVPFSKSLAAPAACPGGAKPDDSGACPNPDMADDDSGDSGDSSSSSDDGHPGSGGNPHAHHVEEGEEKPPTTCASYLKLAGFKDAVYETRSFYQEVAWSENANKPDVCLSLDDILQICHSYRPHYHEPYVHFPAAYLAEMKRVVFIGGGDAMLLHETLKYPSVELVLGLELDQKVVRESHKHFRTQPHFEDPRVQWWFGDAAKSLTLLPREWFGTFDLVMVDLSETAMSISVTDDLDIFGALSLLMKPEGIFVKNELYYGQMSELFDHSVFVYMTDYPILCDQDWAMGSNHHDFLRPTIDGGHMEQHDVHTFEYTPLDDEDHHYKLIKDYSRNDARQQGKCDDWDQEQKDGPPPKKAPVKPDRSAGVLLVVEAEGIDDATKVTSLDATIEDLLKAEGLHPLPPGAVVHADPGEAASRALFVALEEGYIALHHYPANQHVGLDIVLWSQIHKQDALRAQLLDALDASPDSFSSYRVVHGGMLGAKNWKEDVDAVGPVKRNLRRCDPEVVAAEPTTGTGPMPDDVFAAAVKASLTLLPKKMDKVVAVVCGTRGEDGCAIADSLKEGGKVDRVVALWACPPDGKKDKHDDESEIVSHVHVCGPKDLKRSAKIEEGYSAVVVDPKADAKFVSKMQDEFCKKKDMGQHVLMRDQVAMMVSLADELHTVFFASCVKSLVKHMVRSSRLVVDGTAHYGMIGTNNPGFVRRAVAAADAVQASTGLRTQVAKMVGGPVQQQKEYDPEHFPPNAYDERNAFVQYTNQKPVASQSLYQIEVTDAKDAKTLSAKMVKKALDALVQANGSHLGPARRADYVAAIGDGAVAAAVLAAAHVVVIWDGGSRLTLNILTMGEQYEPTPPDAEVPDMVLSGHKGKIVDALLKQLPKSATVAVREQMPRGSNRVVNFKADINAIPNCTDHFVLCNDFSREGECDEEEEQTWMQKYCSLSCGTCDKMTMGGPQGPM